MKRLLYALSICLAFAPMVEARDYYNKKWFDYPDPLTAPKIANGCAHWAITKSVSCHWLKCHSTDAKICTNPTHVQVALLRKDVYVIVSGPDTLDKAVVNAVEGDVTGCVLVALAAAGSPSPTTVGAPAVFFASFKGCILSLTVSGAAGAILKQVDIHVDASHSHWSPV